MPRFGICNKSGKLPEPRSISSSLQASIKIGVIQKQGVVRLATPQKRLIKDFPT